MKAKGKRQLGQPAFFRDEGGTAADGIGVVIERLSPLERLPPSTLFITFLAFIKDCCNVVISVIVF